MKKVALGALLVLLLTIGFSVYLLLSNLDNIVKILLRSSQIVLLVIIALLMVV